MTDGQKKALESIRQAFAEAQEAGFKSDREAFEAFQAIAPQDHVKLGFVNEIADKSLKASASDKISNEQSGGVLALSGDDIDKPKK